MLRKRLGFRPISTGFLLLMRHEFNSVFFSKRMIFGAGLLFFSSISGTYGIASEPVKTINSEDPADILAISTFFLLFFGSIMAILFSYDSISKEKLNQTETWLLVRPITRTQILVAKIMGISMAIFIPMVIAGGIALMVIGFLADVPPHAQWVWFLPMSMIYVIIFVALQHFFSARAKTYNSSLIYGVGVWMIFTFYWILLPLIISFAMGVDVSEEGLTEDNEDYTVINNRIEFLSPNGASMGTMNALGGEATASAITGLPQWAPFASLAGWAIGSILLAQREFTAPERWAKRNSKTY